VWRELRDQVVVVRETVAIILSSPFAVMWSLRLPYHAAMPVDPELTSVVDARMVVVAGEFELEPNERDEFIAQRVDAMQRSRSESGCIEYVIAPDPVEPGRAILFERWESQAALDAHLAGFANASASDAPSIAPRSVSIRVYDVSGERSLR
jgi:quinol monooxygenase YgiN